MEKLSLTALVRLELEPARRSSSGRASKSVYAGHEHVLRQTVIAMVAGQELREHESPGGATVQVAEGTRPALGA